MTAAQPELRRYDELTIGFQLPPLRIVPRIPEEKRSERSEQHYQKIGFQAQPIWGPNLWGQTSRLFREYFGSAWIASGECNLQLRRPMYPEQQLLLGASVREIADGSVEFELWIDNEGGERCASGNARLPLADSYPQPQQPAYIVPDDFKNEHSWPRGELPIGIPCTPKTLLIDAAANAASLAEVNEEAGIYERLVHPRLFLAESFSLKTERPAIEAPQGQRRGGVHVASDVISYLPAPLDREYRFYGTYLDSFETRKGDQWGRKEVVVLDDQRRMVFRTINKFIFNPAAYRKSEGGAA